MERVIPARQRVTVMLRDVCGSGVLLALRVDEMLRSSVGRMFRSAHGARFDDTFAVL